MKEVVENDAPNLHKVRWVRNIENATIERCAQVADEISIDDPDGWCKLIAERIRALKERT